MATNPTFLKATNPRFLASAPSLAYSQKVFANAKPQALGYRKSLRIIRMACHVSHNLDMLYNIVVIDNKDSASKEPQLFDQKAVSNAK